MSDIVIISGTTSYESRTNAVLNYLGEQVKQEELSVSEISVLDINPTVLIQGKYDDPSIVKIIDTIQKAKGVIIASPVYKAAYTGALKTLLDLLPQDILKYKPIYPLMVGGSQAHLLAIDYSFKPLLAALQAQTILRGVYLTDDTIDKLNVIKPITDEKLEERVNEQLREFLVLTRSLTQYSNR
ncbi:NADPH-dependent FMN reductase [Bacillus massiliigorillae]|uniref:NADPH-dependent FMN reductase n=1 Tax=Bacillus massiliigorillae TaxID=1243664 RepID=UPI00039AABDD|nr:NADPH-dependent FMN reductase [Bacillus massiliigorillae]